MPKSKTFHPPKQNRVACPKHLNLSLDQICISPLCLDNCLLCTKCVQKDHNNEEHEIKALGDFMEKNLYKLSLNAKASNKKEYLKRLQSCWERIIENVDYFQLQMIKLVESMRKKVKLHFGTIIESFDEKSFLKSRQQFEKQICLQKVKQLCEKLEIIDKDQFEMNNENLEKIQNSYMKLLSSAHSKVAELMKRFQNISFDYSVEIQNAKQKKDLPELTQSNHQIKQFSCLSEDDGCKQIIAEEMFFQSNFIQTNQNQNTNQKQNKYGLRNRKQKRYNFDTKGRNNLSQDSKSKQAKDLRSRSRDKNRKKQTQFPKQEERYENFNFQQDQNRIDKKRELRRKQNENSIMKCEGIIDIDYTNQNKVGLNSHSISASPVQQNLFQRSILQTKKPQQLLDASMRAKKRQKGKSLKFLGNSQQIEQTQKNQKNQSQQNECKQVLELAPFTIQLLPMKPQKLNPQKKSQNNQQLIENNCLAIKNNSINQNIELPSQTNPQKAIITSQTFVIHKGIKRPTENPTSLTEQQLKHWFFETFKTPDRPYSFIITHRQPQDPIVKGFEYLVFSNDEFRWYSEQFLDLVDERCNIKMYHESLGVYRRK